jgi:hypothetical protein
MPASMTPVRGSAVFLENGPDASQTVSLYDQEIRDCEVKDEKECLRFHHRIDDCLDFVCM